MHLGRSIICLIAVLLFFIQQGTTQSAVNYHSLYNKAEKLSNAPDHSDETDESALQMYREVVEFLSKTEDDNQFLFIANVSTGAFLQVLGRQKESINFFRNALTLKAKLPGLHDSVLFRPLVYCGNAYYTLDQPDKAEALYKKAAEISDKFPDVSEQERLYNTLGVISYSKGNYTESITFYQKAISTLKKKKNYDNTLFVVYQSNLASALRKLRRYDEALKIYLSLLPYKVQTDEIFHNIGAAYLGMSNDDKAIYYLERVNYENQKKQNDLALAYLDKKDYGKAGYYLNKAKILNFRINNTKKNSDYGITLKYWGDLCYQQKQTVSALSYYQEAITNLLTDFKSANYYRNPANFKSAFNGVDLLEILSAKARAFSTLYEQTHRLRDLQASLETHIAFYSLANYISRFYETDESRLVISNRKYLSRDEPINICLRLFSITGDKKFIEKAFSLDEENKANILSLYLDEANRKKQIAPPKLLNDENDLKEAITRMSLKASSENDTSKLRADKNQINDLAVNLFKIQQKINQKTGFSLNNNSGSEISINDLQKNIPAKGVILSYHISSSKLICFVVTDDDFNFFVSELNADFFKAVSGINNLAAEREGNNVRLIRAVGQSLYKKIIKPVEDVIGSKREILIIPDNTLNFLPFELLANDNGEMLLNSHAIIYNYSCKILQKSRLEFSIAGANKLGIAPFAENESATGMNARWNQLPASRQEVQALNGTTLIGKNATKSAFLDKANEFNIIHLATHALANDAHPDQSYILFYPSKMDSDLAYKLYMPEIYNLQLSRTRLIILSACESGAGELAQGEGVMSLSRAFSYSGCDDIITSMWKADDRSTAYISEKLYAQLDKGNTIAEALRQAKLDYLHDPHVISSQKIAGYWAHLRLIGNFEKSQSSHRWIWYVGALAGIVVLITLIRKGRLGYKRPRN